jgi:hypothetical protein
MYAAVLDWLWRSSGTSCFNAHVQHLPVALLVLVSRRPFPLTWRTPCQLMPPPPQKNPLTPYEACSFDLKCDPILSHPITPYRDQVLVRYYVRPEQTHIGRQRHHGARELFLGTQVCGCEEGGGGRCQAPGPADAACRAGAKRSPCGWLMCAMQACVAAGERHSSTRDVRRPYCVQQRLTHTHFYC